MLISPIRKHQMLRCYGVTASRQAFVMNFIYTQNKTKQHHTKGQGS